MSDVLSQSEVESLLAALEAGERGSSRAAAAAVKGVAGKVRQGPPVVPYDFKRPERVSNEQMRAFHALHESFGREFGAALSSMLRTIVEVRLINVEQLTYSEFVAAVSNPTCFNLLRSKSLDGHLILDINPSILFPIVDRLLGGGREAQVALPTRALTDIERRLVSRVTSLATAGLEHAWSNLCSLELSIDQVETNPQLVQIVPPNEVVVLVCFEIAMGESRGIVNLCIPFNTIEPLAGKLSSDAWSTYTRRTADPVQKANLEAGVSRAGVRMVVELARTTLSAGEVMGLAVGDVIVTDREPARGLDVLIESRPMFLAFPGQYKGQKAIRIGRVLEKPRAPAAPQTGSDTAARKGEHGTASP
ncbi:MAG: flagellar motor switch protein FliM [Planctomycetes bacterium]|nr:flagellar motor switch protein FliM [Planctomycetota bacterium]